MMELQTLQEALKVEIQVHQKLVAQMKQDPQNADLKKQLHELQAKITALSEKQKKVVEQLRKDLMVKQEPELKLQLQTQTTQTADSKHLLQISTTPAQQPNPTQNTGVQQKTLTVAPVLTTKTLPLVLKAATTTMPASAAGQCPTVAMVTAISNMPKPVVNSDSQATPINLQVASKLPNQGSDPVRIISKNAIVVQAATTTSAQPIKVPQFVPPARATPRPAYLPQVRPKPPVANNVPIAPAPASAPPPPMVAPPHQLLQRPIMLATKLGPASLPQATPIHQVRIVNGQPCATVTKTTPTGQVTGIVISAPTLQISSLATDAKTVKSQGGPDKVAVSTPPPSTPPPPPVAKPKREENPQKLAFMVSLGLVTHDHLEEIQSRRQERKRRTTANPVYSGAVFEPERKKSTVTYLNTPIHQGTRKRGRPPKYSSTPDASAPPPRPPSGCNPISLAPERLDTGAGATPHPAHTHTLPLPSPSSGDGDIHEDFCAVCRRSGQLLMCDTCSRVYHLPCLEPPLKNIPKGMWICPKCQDQILKKEDAIPWPGTLAIVHSYIAYKEAKEEEKQKLLKWSTDLKLEREQLEQRAKQLTNSITRCMETKNTILARQKDMQASLEKVKHLIVLIQSFERNQALQPETSQPDPDESSKQPGMEESSTVLQPGMVESSTVLQPGTEESSKTSQPSTEESPKSSEPDMEKSSKASEPAMEESHKTSQPGVEESSKSSEPAMEESSKISQPDIEMSSEVVPGDKRDISPEVAMETSSEATVEVSEVRPAEPAPTEEPSSEVESKSKIQLGADGSNGKVGSSTDVGSSTKLESAPEAEATSEAGAGSKVMASSEAEASSVGEVGSVPEGRVEAPAPSRPAEPMELSANGDTDSQSENAGHSHSSAEANTALQPSNGTADVGGQGDTVEEAAQDQKTPSQGKAPEGSQEPVQPVVHNQTESPK